MSSGVGERPPEAKYTGPNTRGGEVRLDLSLGVPVSDESLYEFVSSAGRLSSPSCTPWTWDRRKGTLGFKPKPAGWREAPVCAETESRLCQIENEGVDSTSGFTQVKSSTKVVPLTWWGVDCFLHLRAFKRPAISDLSKEFCQSNVPFVLVGKQQLHDSHVLQNTRDNLWFLNWESQVG